MCHVKIHTTSLIHRVRVVQKYRVVFTSFGLLPGRSGRHPYCLLLTLQIHFTRYLVFSNIFTRYLVFSTNLAPYFRTLSLARYKVRVNSEWWTTHDLQIVAAKYSGIFLHALSTFLSNEPQFPKKKQHCFLKGPPSRHDCHSGKSNRQMKIG
jgi:hypothetical protein